MPNLAYQRGNAFERRVKADLESRGYLVRQVRGSKGSFDIIAAQSSGVLLVQVKSGETPVSHAAWNRLVDDAHLGYAEPLIADRAERPRGGIRYRLVTGYHTHGSRHWPAEDWTP